MKTLTIKQPWASLIAHGIKDIENRTWSTKYRGRILIHSSAKFAGALYDLLSMDQINEMDRLSDVIPDMPVSAIIGEVDIIDCVISHPSIWAEKTSSVPDDVYNTENGLPSYLGKHHKDVIYNWVLANPVLYDEPILNVKGKLSLWEFNKELV